MLSFLNVFSQNDKMTIVLKDAQSNLPIVDVRIFIVITKQSLLSNAEGTVTFILKEKSEIEISHPDYASVSVKSSSLKSDENVVFLKKNIVNLEEIIITKQHPQKILKNLIKNSIHSFTMNAWLKVYVREFCKIDGMYSYFNDGLLNFQVLGKNKDFKNDILVEQNRSFGLTIPGIGPDALGYDLNDIMANYHDFKYLKPVLESSAQNKYVFSIKGDSKNDDLYVMTISPSEKIKGLQDDFSIIYDWKNKLIMEIASHVSAETLDKIKEKPKAGSRNVYKSFVKMIYRFDGSNYYLLSSKEEIGFEQIDKKYKDLKTNVEVINYFITTNFSQEDFVYDQKQVFRGKTLYNKKNVVYTDYWNVSGLTTTQEEEEIIESIGFRE